MVRVASTRLVRVSRFDSGEPFFGHSAGNRFDDPDKRFGTCYSGFDLVTAIAETVLHDEVPRNGRFAISRTELESRHVIRFSAGQPLVLAKFAGPALKATVGDGAISTVMPYDLPQQWAAAVHAHPVAVDGILYVSRQVNDRKAVVVFERAAAKLGVATYQPIVRSRALAFARRTLRIDYAFP